MSKSITAALWSGLIFPGAGHLYLKLYGRGISLIVVSAICLVIILSNVAEQSMAVVAKIQADGGNIDPSRILEMASQGSSASVDTQSFNIAMIVFSVCWIVGVVDAYRLGKR